MLAFDEQRISLTFRVVHTFRAPNGRLFGGGATCKTKKELDEKFGNNNDNSNEKTSHVNDNNNNNDNSNDDDEEEMKAMLKAFSMENRSSIDWQEIYGKGFDCQFPDEEEVVVVVEQQTDDNNVLK